MASINDRWWVRHPDGNKSKSDRYGTGLRWQVRYRNEVGKGRNKSFEKRVDAERFLASVSVSLHQGTYIDRVTSSKPFSEVAALWLASRIVDVSTIVQTEVHIRRHMNPRWGSVKIGDIRPAQIQQWISSLKQAGLADKYIRLIYANFRLIMGYAEADNLIAINPCNSKIIKVPSSSRKRLETITTSQVRALIKAFPEELKLVPLLAATCGLRQGEVFGLRIQDVNFEQKIIYVRQQIKLINHKPTPTLPKGRKTRFVPIPDFVLQSIEEHVEKSPPLEGERTVEPSVGGILLSLRERKPINKNYFNFAIWDKALETAGIVKIRETGMHGLRHYCASTWLQNNVNIKAVSEYLGHSDAGFTLRTYTHLIGSVESMPKFSFKNLE